jgi:hypothetical protein
MTTTTTTDIEAPSYTPKPPIAVPYVPNRKISAAEIEIPTFTPAPVEPTPQQVSADKPSGEWPTSPATLESIDAILTECCNHADKNVRAKILIINCIERGIDTSASITAVGKALNFNPFHVRTILREGAKSDPTGSRYQWRTGLDGRFVLN